MDESLIQTTLENSSRAAAAASGRDGVEERKILGPSGSRSFTPNFLSGSGFSALTSRSMAAVCEMNKKASGFRRALKLLRCSELSLWRGGGSI